MGPGNTPKSLILSFHIILLCACILLPGAANNVLSQHIPITNPSLEGIPAERQAPPGWKPVRTSDIQPGIYNITKPASVGSTYVGLHSGPNYTEGISQQLAGSMKAGYQYSIYFDLAFAPLYAYEACYANLAIYGGNLEGELKELLWSSGDFYDTAWMRHDASFTPAASYPWLTFVAYYPTDCNKSLHGVAVLIDNISSWLYEHPKLEFSIRPACVDDNTGAVRVMVLGADPPYTYQWSPGGAITPVIANLSPGKYEVRVTDSKGIVTQGSATVPLTDLASQVTVTPSRCHGDEQNSISLHTTGGLPPYRYYFNGSNNVAYTPLFERLKPGVYAVTVKDEQGCLNVLTDITVEEPPLLQIRSVTVKPCSCSEVNNGKIIPQPEGGVPPYEFSLDNGLWQADSVLGELSPGNYHYEIKDSKGCYIRGAAEITSPYLHCFVILPNAFSPNGDGNNDVFRPKVYDDVHNYRLSIYNRWGSLVFRTNDPGAGWNGAYKGSAAPAQHYIYVCTYTDRNNEPQELRGAFMLVR
ncbi:MAG TPA: gliding motility-associated C-terminal domain-containing protein [Chitinophaga sp.]